METSNGIRHMLSVWRAMLVHVEQNGVKKMAQSGAVYNLKIAEFWFTNSCPPWVEGPMRKSHIRSHTTFEVQLDEKFLLLLCKWTFRQSGRLSISMFLIDKASKHVRVYHLKTKNVVSMLLKQNFHWVKGWTDCRTIKIVINGDLKYTKRTKDFEAHKLKYAYYRKLEPRGDWTDGEDY